MGAISFRHVPSRNPAAGGAEEMDLALPVVGDEDAFHAALEQPGEIGLRRESGH
jgi:hypothetical protein